MFLYIALINKANIETIVQMVNSISGYLLQKYAYYLYWFSLFPNSVSTLNASQTMYGFITSFVNFIGCILLSISKHLVNLQRYLSVSSYESIETNFFFDHETSD